MEADATSMLPTKRIRELPRIQRQEHGLHSCGNVSSPRDTRCRNSSARSSRIVWTECRSTVRLRFGITRRSGTAGCRLEREWNLVDSLVILLHGKSGQDFESSRFGICYRTVPMLDLIRTPIEQYVSSGNERHCYDV